MKRVLPNLFFLVTVFCLAQTGEFKIYDNGLIYNSSTMNKLSYIVDSLNLQFNYCDLEKKYFAKSQAIGHYFELKKGNLKQAKNDIDDGMDFETFIRKYKDVKVDKELLIVKFIDKNFKNEEALKFSEIAFGNRYGSSFTYKNDEIPYNKKMKGLYAYEHTKKGTYFEESIEGFYFVSEFTSIEMPEEYSKMIQYADCLIDTTAVKISKDAKRGYIELPKNYDKLTFNKKVALLDKFRNTKVVGGCSMDDSPRIHAANIAKLSAETINWSIFLKAHLDIMNDRFDRLSDGSYATAGRKTYIKELEELNINVKDLLLGISLRVENPSTNHYYGSIGRLGRALSETKNSKIFKSEILSMIRDNNLDDYNRVLAYFLFENYNHYLNDNAQKEINLKQLKLALNFLPNYLKVQINKREN